MSMEPNERPAETQDIRAVAYVRVSDGQDNAEQGVASHQDGIQWGADDRDGLAPKIFSKQKAIENTTNFGMRTSASDIGDSCRPTI